MTDGMADSIVDYLSYVFIQMEDRYLLSLTV